MFPIFFPAKKVIEMEHAEQPRLVFVSWNLQYVIPDDVRNKIPVS